jgi:hypothetical protein
MRQLDGARRLPPATHGACMHAYAHAACYPATSLSWLLLGLAGGAGLLFIKASIHAMLPLAMYNACIEQEGRGVGLAAASRGLGGPAFSDLTTWDCHGDETTVELFSLKLTCLGLLLCTICPSLSLYVPRFL